MVFGFFVSFACFWFFFFFVILFSIKFPVLLLLICRSSLYDIDINLLLVTNIASNLSQSLNYYLLFDFIFFFTINGIFIFKGHFRWFQCRWFLDEVAELFGRDWFSFIHTFESMSMTIYLDVSDKSSPSVWREQISLEYPMQRILHRGILFYSTTFSYVIKARTGYNTA